MADGEILIRTRIDLDKAKADLKLLQAKAKSTAQQISAVDKEIAAIKGNTKLADDLEKARAAAEATARELEEVTSRIDAARHSRFGEAAVNPKDVAQSDQLAAALTQQDEKAAKLEAAYRRQKQTLSDLELRHEALNRLLEQEQAAAAQAGTEYIRNAHAAEEAEESQKAINQRIDAVRAGLERFGQAYKAFGKKLASVFAGAAAELKGFLARLVPSTKMLDRMNSRLKGIVSGALIFNGISAALRSLTGYLKTAVAGTGQMRSALANLQGAAATAAAPIIQTLTPALTALANAAATVFAYLAKLISFFTGKSLASMQASAKAMNSVGSAAGSTARQVDKAKKSLAAFDEINTLGEKQDDISGGSGGAGGTADLVPNYDFTGGKSPFLDSILDAIEKGDWFRVGRLVGEKLRDSLDAISWPDIQDKAKTWAVSLASAVNGAITTPGLWDSIGHTAAQALNTVTGTVDAWVKSVSWWDLGKGLADGLTRMVGETDWAALGRALTDGLYMAFTTLHGFVANYSGWTELGVSVAVMVGSAFGNINWPQVFGDLGALAVGLLQAVNTAIESTDWETVKATIGDCLKAIDWPGLLREIGELLSNLMPVLLPALLFVGAQAALSLFMTILSKAVIDALAALLAETVLPALATGIASIVSAIGLWPILITAALAAIGAAVLAWLVRHWDDITATVSQGWESICDACTQFGEQVAMLWDAYWTQVKEDAAALWDGIKTGWGNFWDGLQTLLTAAGATVRAIWQGLWSGLADTVTGIWNGIVSTIKGCINGILGFINGMVSGIVSGLNAVIGLLNKLSFDIPDWVPEFGGKTFGFDIGTLTAPQIPYLAQGAVIPPNREFLAVLGDQSHGTNVEAPLATIEQAVAGVMGDNIAAMMAGFEALRDELAALRGDVQGIRVGDAAIGRASARFDRRMAIIQGG